MAAALLVVLGVVLGQQVAPIVVAVGLAHDGVDMEALRLGVAQEDAGGVVVVLDQCDW